MRVQLLSTTVSTTTPEQIVDDRSPLLFSSPVICSYKSEQSLLSIWHNVPASEKHTSLAS